MGDDELLFTVTAPATTLLLRHADELPRNIWSCWNEYRSALARKSPTEAMHTVLSRWKLDHLYTEFSEMHSQAVTTWEQRSLDDGPRTRRDKHPV
jgi:hypothetical protein